MASYQPEIHNKFYDQNPGLSSTKITEKIFQKVLKVIKNRQTFVKYLKLIDDYELTTNVKNESLLKRIITNETELKEFIHILLHTGQDDIAKAIDPKVEDLCDLTQCDPISGNKDQFSFGDTNTREIIENPGKDISNSIKGGIYTMNSSPRGYCLLINNYFTIGTYKEMQRLRNIFYQFHFDVIPKKNLSIIEIIELLKEMSEKPELSKHDAFVFIIITPGNDNKQIFDSDNNPLEISNLVNLFNDKYCPNLKEKPRLFFINCINNQNPDLCDKSSDVIQRSKISSPSNDIFICFSAFEEKVDWNKGTHFGRELANSLVKKGWYKDLLQLVTRANNHLKPIYGKSIEWTTLDRVIYFNHLDPERRAYYSKNNSYMMDVEKTLNDFILNNLGQSLAKENLIQLSKQLCKRLSCWHTNRTVHNNINPENIKVSIPENIGQREIIIGGDFGNTTILFTGDMTGSKSNKGNLCWKSPEVIKALDRNDNFETTEENDIFSLGCIIYFVITRVKHPFDFRSDYITNNVINFNALSGLENVIYTDLIKSMVNNIKKERPSINNVLIHPMFWKPEKILSFYTHIKNFLHVKDENIHLMKTEDFKIKLKSIKAQLKSEGNAMYGNNWLKLLSQGIQDKENEKIAQKNPKHPHRIRDPTSCVDLLDYIRNKYQHNNEWEKELKICFGDTVDSYIEYFRKVFPSLLIITYNAMKDLQDEEQLKKYYSM